MPLDVSEKPRSAGFFLPVTQRLTSGFFVRSISYLLIAISVVALSLYLRGLHGGFLFDDFPNIVDNPAISAVDGSLFRWLLAAFSSDSGLLRRPISMLSFALSYHWGGMNAAAFKLFNILIHLVNGILIYRLAALLLPLLAVGQPTDKTQDTHRLLALLVCACWLLHPLHVSSVLYVVQRMNLLSSLFILLGLLCYAHSRYALRDGTGRWVPPALGFFLFGALAVLSKENGALLPLYAFIVELFCFRFATAQPIASKALKLTYLLGLAMPVALLAIYIVMHPASLLDRFSQRDFTLTERVLTQCRVLWEYLLWTFIPNPHWMALYHDDIAYSHSLFSPVTTAIALFGLAGLALLAVLWRNKQPAFGFAVGWFFAGHAMESTVLPLEMVFEHRHYLPMVGILLGSAGFAAQFKPRRRQLVWAAALAVVATLGVATAQRTWVWGDPLRIAVAAAEDHPDSPRSLYDAGRALLAPQRPEVDRQASLQQARGYFSRAMQLQPTDINSAVGLMLSYQKEPVAPLALVNDLAQRLRHNPMLSPIPMLSLLRVSAGGTLPLKPDEMATLVNAALENESMDALLRGLILSTYGYYLMEAAHDSAGAISATMAAIELVPGYALFQLNAAYLAQRLGQPEKAAQYLNAASAMDLEQTYTNEILDLRKKLATALVTTPGG